MKNNKKAAMEMTMGTIVTIVLLVSVMVLGLVFVRNIMCAGIVLTDDITTGTTNEIKNLFGTRAYGVKCMGEDGQEVKIGGGGLRHITCVINSESETYYELEVLSIEALDGESTSEVETWQLDRDWDDTIFPGSFETTSVLLLDIPSDVSKTILKIEVGETKDGDSKPTHDLYLEIVPAGGFTKAVC